MRTNMAASSSMVLPSPSFSAPPPACYCGAGVVLAAFGDVFMEGGDKEYMVSST